jgi:hypothetical protein
LVIRPKAPYLKKNHDTHFQNNQILKDKIKKKNYTKGFKIKN